MAGIKSKTINWDLEIPQSNHPASVNIYILGGEEDQKEGRQKGWREVNMKLENRKVGRKKKNVGKGKAKESKIV